MPSTTLTIDQIEISPLNVRTHRPDAEDTGALEASILAEGLLNPIVVHPMLGRKGKWGAVAGGRRTRAIKALVGRGDLPAGWPVKVDVREGLSDAELIEVSIAENLLRKDLREHELFAAIARAKAKGHDPETIARQLGQHDVAKVRRWARLGELAKPIFAALVAEEIALEVAAAYAATSDTALQLAVFERIKAEGRYHTAHTVRTALKVGDREEARLLTFVGEAVYRAAGGSYELDLFADVEPDRGRVTHPDLLRRLVEEKLTTVRDQVRVGVQDTGLRFIAEPPQTDYGTPDHQLQVTPKKTAAGTLILPEGKAGAVVAHIAIDAGGEPVVSYWWESRKAKYGSEPAEAKKAPVSAGPLREGIGINDLASPGEAKRAIAIVKEEEGIAGDSLQVVRSVRKKTLGAMLVENARAGDDVATDYLVWAQLRMLAGDYGERVGQAQVGLRSIQTGFEAGVSGALERIHAELKAQPATRTIADAVLELTRQTFFTGPDLGDAFLDYRASSSRLKQLAAAVVVGMALERSLNTPGFRLAAHDAVAAEIIGPGDPDEVVRRHWQPTSSFLGALPKAQLLAIVEPLVDAKTHAAWAKLKTAELVEEAAGVLAGTHPSLRTDAREAAARWVHPLLRFDPPPRDPEPDEDHNANGSLAEAAE